MTTGDVNGSWMEDGSHVKVDLGPVVIEDNRSTRGQIQSAVTMAVQANDTGMLTFDGETYPCRFEYRETEGRFTLLALSNDGTVSLVFRDGVISASNPDLASAACEIVCGGAEPCRATANGARLVNEPAVQG